MKPGKRDRFRVKPPAKQSREQQEVASSAPVPEVPPSVAVPGQSRVVSPNPQIIPVNLLGALEKMRGGGAVPVFITRELEKFLTEQGVFRDDMRPAEAWAKLNEIAGFEPEPEPPAAS